MSFCLRPNVCKKCGKPLTLFEGWTCLECEKVEQESILDKIRAEIADNHDYYFFAESNKDIALGLEFALDIIDKYK